MLNDEKITIRRKNVFLDVSPLALESYLAKGYTRVDANGNPIVEKPKTVSSDEVQKIRKSYEDKIKELVGKIKELEDKLAESAKKAEVQPDAEEVKPVKTQRKSKR